MAGGSSSSGKYYNYDPSTAAAIIFTVLFILTTTLHLYQLIGTRTWYFIPLTIGGIFECVGYIARAISCHQTPNWTLGPYIVQTILILVAPALFAASVYMTLGRIILVVDGEAQSLIKKKWLTKIFVLGDVISFFVQAAGGAMLAKQTADSATRGKNTILIGLFIQIFFFAFFMVVALLFDLRMRKSPTTRAASGVIPWRKHQHTLYAASALILIRSIFRVAEYMQGRDGYLLDHEIYLYIFDAVLMLGVMILFNIVHPSEVKALLKGGRMATAGVKLVELQGGEEYNAFRSSAVRIDSR